MASRHAGRERDQPRERQNEYFLPGDGIIREVIQADLCRYLGNDATVRPGEYEVRKSPLYGWITVGQRRNADICPGPSRIPH